MRHSVLLIIFPGARFQVSVESGHGLDYLQKEGKREKLVQELLDSCIVPHPVVSVSTAVHPREALTDIQTRPRGCAEQRED